MTAISVAAAHTDALPPTWRLVVKFLYFLALALAIGAAWCHLTVVGPSLRGHARAARRSPGSDAADPDATVGCGTVDGPDQGEAVALRRLERRSLRLVGVGGLCLLLVALPQLASRVSRMREGAGLTESMRPSAIRAYLTAPAKRGEWVSTGQLITAQNALILIVGLAALALLVGGAARAGRALAVIVALGSVAASLVASVPTKAVTLETFAPKVLIQTHIVGGSLWVGGLITLAVLGLAARRHGAGDEDSDGAGIAVANVWAQIWRRFGVLALVAVGGVLLSGLWLTYDEVGAFGQFLSTPFGRFLLVKIVLVLGLVVAGAFNQLSLMPRIERAREAGDRRGVIAVALHHFPRVVWTEVVLGVGVLAIVPFLATSARSQAAGHEVDGPTFDGRLFLLGLVLLATMAASFYGTTRASDALGRRGASADDASRASVRGVERRIDQGEDRELGEKVMS